MEDKAYLQRHKDCIMACEANLLEAELDYAERMYDLNKTACEKALLELQTKLGADNNDVYQENLAAAKTCAESHRVREHEKQKKQWTEALSRQETSSLGLKRRPKNPPTRKPRSNAPDAQKAGPSGWTPNNNGRQYLRAQRRLPGNNGPRGRPQATTSRNNADPDTETLAQAVHIAISALRK